jgi:hypothetical protein
MRGGRNFAVTKDEARGVKMRALLWGALTVAFVAMSFHAAASAAEIDLGKRHVRSHHAKRVAYADCRTGWWRLYCNGEYRPRWAMRCG